jgi:hypothetical protein
MRRLPAPLERYVTLHPNGAILVSCEHPACAIHSSVDPDAQVPCPGHVLWTRYVLACVGEGRCPFPGHGRLDPQLAPDHRRAPSALGYAMLHPEATIGSPFDRQGVVSRWDLAGATAAGGCAQCGWRWSATENAYAIARVVGKPFAMSSPT